MSLLYHYTSYETLYRILTSNEMWATNIAYLNDSMEFAHTPELMGKMSNPFSEQCVAGLHHSSTNRPQKFLQESLKRMSPFVICFSAEEDLLSQWRAYCPPSGGVAIGFDEQALGLLASSHQAELVQCKYDVDEKKQELVVLLERALQEEDTNSELIRLAICFKDSAFEAENEWRIGLQPEPKSVKFRPGTGLLVPYFPVELLDKAVHLIREVRLGPTFHPELSERSVASLLDVEGIRANVKHSAISFRNW